jgi:hypothetical protein
LLARRRELWLLSPAAPAADAARMNLAHSGAAMVAPVPGRLVFSSRPAHTTHANDGVYRGIRTSSHSSHCTHDK